MPVRAEEDSGDVVKVRALFNGHHPVKTARTSTDAVLSPRARAPNFGDNSSTSVHNPSGTRHCDRTLTKTRHHAAQLVTTHPNDQGRHYTRPYCVIYCTAEPFTIEGVHPATFPVGLVGVALDAPSPEPVELRNGNNWGGSESLSVAPADVQNLGRYLYETVVGIRSALERAALDVDGVLDGSWTGAASDAFRSGWSDVRDGGNAIASALSDMAEKLGITAETYRGQDQSAAGDLSGTASSLDLPGLS